MSFREKQTPPAHRISAAELADEVSRNVGLIHRTAIRWRRANPRIPLEEYLGAVQAGWVMAARLFDRRRGLKFSTYAVHWADDQVRQLLDFYDPRTGPGRSRQALYRRLRRTGEDPADLPKVCYGMETLGSESGESTDSLEFWLAAPEDDRPELPEDFWERIEAVLSEREYRVIRARFVEDLTLHEVGVREGLTRERIRQVEGTALRKVAERCRLDECLLSK